MEANIPNNARHIPPGETRPACNRCQYIARAANVEGCPYCGGNWTHDVTNPGAVGVLRATPPATEVPTASGEAGERERQIRALREDVAGKLQGHMYADAKYPGWHHQRLLRVDCLLEDIDYLLAKLDASRAALESTFQHAAGLQQQLAEAGAGWPISSPLLWKIAERIADRIHQAVKMPEHQAPHIDWDDVSNDWWNYLDEMLRPGGTPDADRPAQVPPQAAAEAGEGPANG